MHQFILSEENKENDCQINSFDLILNDFILCLSVFYFLKICISLFLNIIELNALHT